MKKTSGPIMVDMNVNNIAPLRGTAKFMTHLVSGLRSLDSSIEIFEGVTIKYYKFFFYVISEQLFLPALIFFRRPSFIVCGNHTVPLLTFGTSRVVIIHDVLFEDFIKFSNIFTLKKASLLYRKLLIRYAIRKKNSVIVTVSKTSKNRIVELYKIDPDKIHVITNVYDSYQNIKRFDKPLPKFALAVTGPAEHKNATFLLEVYLKYKLYNELPLIIVGNFSRSLTNFFSSASKSKILFFKEIDDHQLDFFYRKCSMLIMPSLDEGFGIPLVQAMKYEKKILCSDIPIFRELVVKHGFLFNPKNEESFVKIFKKCMAFKDVTKYPNINKYNPNTQKDQIKKLFLRLKNE